MEETTILKAPFPWFGGKAPVAPEVWKRFGRVSNYVEPFFGSGAILLNRPHPPKVETVNDMDAFLTNFWRAIQYEPDKVAKHADRMVNEVDLAAWRDWLYSDMSFQDRMWRDPEHYDAKRAGIWVWGVCSTIASAWGPKEPKKKKKDASGEDEVRRASTHLSGPQGIHRASTHLGDAGRGVNRPLSDFTITHEDSMRKYFAALKKRLRGVRVMCGDWTRVTSPTATTHQGITGMFLDPPYIDNCSKTYDHNEDVREAVRAYCIERGEDRKMRIALCGYEGEHEMPESWSTFKWKARGGYGSQADGQGRVNAKRERIWFSPHCRPAEKAGFGFGD